jgi:hypothetical protein
MVVVQDTSENRILPVRRMMCTKRLNSPHINLITINHIDDDLPIGRDARVNMAYDEFLVIQFEMFFDFTKDKYERIYK